MTISDRRPLHASSTSNWKPSGSGLNTTAPCLMASMPAPRSMAVASALAIRRNGIVTSMRSDPQKQRNAYAAGKISILATFQPQIA